MNRIARTFQAFRYRDFRLMWVGAFTSTTGTWMQTVAQSWLVLSLTGSAFYLGLTGFLSELPFILFTLLGGAVADRLDRRKLLLGSQYVQMTCAFILTALVVTHRVQIWQMLVLVFVAGTAQSFGGPAYQALLPGLVSRDEVPNVIAMNSIQFNLARVFGPLLAGATLSALGAAYCFGLNGLSFLAVIASLYMIRATFVPQKTNETVLEGIRNGLRFIKGRGSLWQLSVLGFISTFCGVPLLTLLPLFAKNVFQNGAAGYSHLMATSGAGAITGALLFAGGTHQHGQGKRTLVLQIAFAALMAAFAWSRNLGLSHLVLFLAGMCLIILFASVTSLIQLIASDEMRGRVLSVFMLAFRGGMPLGNLAMGLLASKLSPSYALTISGFAMAATAVGFLTFGKGVQKL